MLLIFCDMFKALWYLVPAAVRLAGGPVLSNSPFCSASGFLLAFSIESAGTLSRRALPELFAQLTIVLDCGNLVIAIHGSMCIFKPRTHLGEPGLYQYRKYVYAAWFLLPLLMAGLAFVQPGGVYVNQGTFCYLPVRPFWYRLALSWIPRYVILITIVLLYLAIYVYVLKKFRRFGFDNKTANKRPSYSSISLEGRPIPQGDGAADSLQTTAVGLDSDPSSRRPSEPLHAGGFQGLIGAGWENYQFGSSSMPIDPVPESETIDPLELEPLSPRQARNMSLATTVQGTVIEDNGHRPHRSDAWTLIRALRETSPSAFDGTFDGTYNDCPASDRTITNPALRARHTAIKRQLRFLFVYPATYFLAWLVPFVHHCLQYSDVYSANPSFALSSTSIVLLAMQCAFNVTLFAWREKPWRFIHRASASFTKRPSFWSSITLCRHGSDDSSSERRDSGRSGRTLALVERAVKGESRAGKGKGEMLAEARAARARREVEEAMAREEREKKAGKRKMSLLRRGGGEKNWWEVEGRKRKDSVLLGIDQTQLGGDTVVSKSGDRGVGTERSRSERSLRRVDRGMMESVKEEDEDSEIGTSRSRTGDEVPLGQRAMPTVDEDEKRG